MQTSLITGVLITSSSAWYPLLPFSFISCCSSFQVSASCIIKLRKIEHENSNLLEDDLPRVEPLEVGHHKGEVHRSSNNHDQRQQPHQEGHCAGSLHLSILGANSNKDQVMTLKDRVACCGGIKLAVFDSKIPVMKIGMGRRRLKKRWRVIVTLVSFRTLVH